MTSIQRMLIHMERLIRTLTAFILTFVCISHYTVKAAKPNRLPNIDAFLLAKRGDGDQKLFFKGTEFPEVSFAAKHKDLVLECEVGGAPTPTIHWLKNGERIQQGFTRDFKDDTATYEQEMNPSDAPMLRLGKVKSKLYLDCATAKDEAQYTCVAETPFERITQNTYLQIENDLSITSEEVGSCLTKRALRGSPARIYLWTAVRLELEGKAVQLFCRAEGYPAPQCSWRYSEYGEELSHDDQHKVLPNGDLLINNIDWMENMGNYFCRCSNSAGSDEQSTFLYPTTP